ncbi:MAG: phage tail protein [Bacteroidota bacterium]
MGTYYPPLGFHFKVEFLTIPGEFEFQSVSGLSTEMKTEEYAEGGENRFSHKLPVRTSFPNLVLKRGMKVNSALALWCRSAIEQFVILPSDIIISLLNEEHEPLTVWYVAHAYPVKWSVSDFNAEENKLVIESIELAYNHFNVI